MRVRNPPRAPLRKRFGVRDPAGNLTGVETDCRHRSPCPDDFSERRVPLDKMRYTVAARSIVVLLRPKRRGSVYEPPPRSHALHRMCFIRGLLLCCCCFRATCTSIVQPTNIFSPEQRGLAPFAASQIRVKTAVNQMEQSVEKIIERNLLEVFNERAADIRRRAIDELWDKSGVFIDPGGVHKGVEEINTVVELLFTQFEGYVFSVRGPGQSMHGVGRLPWSYGPPDDPQRITGTDVGVTKDGKLTSLYVFTDPPSQT
jgi:hypothetical protein